MWTEILRLRFSYHALQRSNFITRDMHRMLHIFNFLSSIESFILSRVWDNWIFKINGLEGKRQLIWWLKSLNRFWISIEGAAVGFTPVFTLRQMEGKCFKRHKGVFPSKTNGSFQIGSKNYQVGTFRPK